MRKILLVLVFILFLPTLILPAAAQQDIVTISVNAGFAGRFRDNLWMPILVSVTNNGDPIEGQIVVRPERTDALTNTFSTPISLATGARQSALLYATLRNFAQNLTVEIQDSNGTIVSDITVPMRQIAPKDRLHVVITNAATSNIDLTSLHAAEQEAVQVNWFPANLPDNLAALQAIDTIVFSDIDTGELTAKQRETISSWVNQGGHLIVTGGANWQPTAAGLSELMPLIPNSSESVRDVSAISELAGDYSTDFSGDYIVSQGRLTDDARVLAEASDGTPLVVRHKKGYGVVDYLALDPSVEPLRDWDRLSDLWFTLGTSLPVRPGWTYGLLNNSTSLTSMEILPGITALPEALAMVGFLALYIVVIGPLNYFLLSRINRLEFAWLTIPLSIAIFTALAWATGFNLRGNDVILSRLSVIQSWPDQETAYLEQFIGLLAPRRANYTLDVQDDRALRPLSRVDQTSFFATTSSNVNIRQSNSFTAANFPVDASFVAGFTALGTTQSPAVSGSATLSYESNNTSISVRGSMRNDTDQIIDEPVIIARGMIIRLGEALEPGEVRPFNQTRAINEMMEPAPASPIEYSVGFANTQGTRISRNNMNVISPLETADEILEDEDFRVTSGTLQSADEASQEYLRRYYFLNTFMVDQLNSTARGNNVYFAGWVNEAPTEEELGVNWSAVDSTIYLVALETEFVQNPSNTVVHPDQFSWVSLEKDGFLDASPSATSLFSDGTISFRFTPLPENVLSEVDEMNIIFERAGGSTRETEVNLWDWREEQWIPIVLDDEMTTVRNHERFIGPLNAVQIQIVRSTTSGSLSLRRLSIEQRGSL